MKNGGQLKFKRKNRQHYGGSGKSLARQDTNTVHGGEKKQKKQTLVKKKTILAALSYFNASILQISCFISFFLVLPLYAFAL